MTKKQDKPGYIWPGVGVGAVTRLQGNILMVKRAGAHASGTWAVPGGWVEKWEHPYHTAIRETLEETGILVKVKGRKGWTDSQFYVEDLHSVVLWVDCEYISGNPTIMEPDKCPEVKWIPIYQLASLKLFSPFDEIVKAEFRISYKCDPLSTNAESKVLHEYEDTNHCVSDREQVQCVNCGRIAYRPLPDKIGDR